MKTISTSGQASLLFVLALLVMAFGMGKAPLFLEEPRRAIVAMEMLYSGDYFHTTIHGEPYYNKPPFFNWVIAAGFHLFGYHEWILRCLTVVSHVGVGIIVYLSGRKYMNAQSGLLAAALYLAGGDILFGFSLIGEIDIFFTFLVVCGWFGYFHFGEQQKKLWAFSILYFFMGLAFLTKGLPAILFLGLTLIAWQFYNKDIRSLFSLAHLTGVLIFCVLLGFYFFPFFKQGDFNTLINTFWNQSLERTATAISIPQRIISLFTFPLVLLKDLLPGALLLIVFSGLVFKKSLVSNRLFLFCCLIFAANIWVYWISPETRSRYHYMFHPLLYLPIVFVYLQQSGHRWNKIVNSLFKFIPYVVLVLLIAGVFLIPILLKTKGVLLIAPIGLIIGLFLFWFGKNQQWHPVFMAVIMMMILRSAYGYIVVSERSQNSQASKDKQVGLDIAKIVKTNRVGLLDSTRISTTISYYLEKDLQRIVPYVDKPLKGDFVILPDSTTTAAMDVQLSFDYQQHTFNLVQMP